MESIQLNTLVMKFGGSSVGTPAAMAQTVAIIQRQRTLTPRLVVVTSALSGTTDRLLNSAQAAVHGNLETSREAVTAIHEQHHTILTTLVTDPQQCSRVQQELDALITEFATLCQAIAVLGEATPRALDAVASLGERLSVCVLAAALSSQGVAAQAVEATRLVVTDDHFQSAHPDFPLTQAATHNELDPLLERGIVPVITGFIGATRTGITTTLGRGGSDYTAALLGAALPADEVWIWTDVDGVMTADPRIIPGASTIQKLTYREISELAYAGAKVLHPKTLRPVIEAGIGLRVLNTFNPENPGTRLVSELNHPETGMIKSITTIRGQSLVTLEGRGMLGVPGVAARLFAAIAATQTSVTLISQAASEQSICFAVPVENAQRVVDAICNEFFREIQRQDIDRAWASEEVVIFTVVGEGMRSTPGVSGLIFSTLGLHGINVIAIAQGSSEVSISFILKSEDLRPALQVLHDSVIGKGAA